MAPAPELAPHGTRTAYLRHRRHKETACEPCLEANRVWGRQQRARRRAGRAPSNAPKTPSDAPKTPSDAPEPPTAPKTPPTAPKTPPATPKTLSDVLEEASVSIPEGPGGNRLAELEWQLEQLRLAIVWAGEFDPSKVAALSKERREVLADIAKLNDSDEAEGGALGEFLSGPTGLVRFPTAEDRKQA